MLCHYIYDTKAEKVFIPGCWGGAIYGPDRCHCKRKPQTFAQFENQKYREKLSELSKEVHELEKENARLHRIIKKLVRSKG